jgi:hypothetical protein
MTTYHFRLVAANQVGTTEGLDGTFATRSSGVPGPPAGRGYELVSPADDGQYDVGLPWTAAEGVTAGPGAQAATPDGRHVVLKLDVGGTLPGMAPDGEIADYAIASRGDAGWGLEVPLGDRSGVGGCNLTGGNVNFDTLGNDGGALLVRFGCLADKLRFSAGLDQREAPEGLYGARVVGDAATFVGAKFGSDGPLPRTEALDQFVGASPDLSAVYFSTTAGLLPDVPDDSSAKIYRRAGEGPPELITKTATGASFGVSAITPQPFSRPGAVSDDGDAITLTAPSNSPMVAADVNAVQDVYQVMDGEALWVSDPEAVPPANRPAPQTPANRVFQGASASGSVVFFSTTEKLTADDLDTALDIYAYDDREPADSRIARVSRSDIGACSGCDDNTSSTAAQSHSQAKFVASSADGSRMFLVTGDVLSEADADGQQSLYVHHLASRTTTYVAPAGAGVTTASNGADAGTSTTGSLAVATQNFSNRAIKLSTDGSVAAMSLATNVDLPAGNGGTDGDGARDLFVWREGDGLRRVRQGVGPDVGTLTVPTLGCYLRAANPNKARCRAITADGSLMFFETADPLVAHDANELVDVYAYHTADGSVELISPPSDRPFGDFSAEYVDSSASGDQVIFLTRETLDPSRDRDGGRVDMYVARAGEVFPPLAPPSPPCAGDACLPPPSPEPGRPAIGSGQSGPPEDSVAGGERVVRSLSLLKPSRAAVRRFATTGRLALKVRLAGGGVVRVRATGKVGRRTRTLGTASRRVRRRSATTVRLTLRLSRAGRRELRRTRRLRVRIAVGASPLLPRRSATVTLSLPKRGG